MVVFQAFLNSLLEFYFSETFQDFKEEELSSLELFIQDPKTSFLHVVSYKQLKWSVSVQPLEVSPLKGLILVKRVPILSKEMSWMEQLHVIHLPLANSLS